MGRFIEDQVLDYLANELGRKGVKKLRLPYLPTKKNMPAKAMLDRLKGNVVWHDDNGGMTWEYDLTQGSPAEEAGICGIDPELNVAVCG